MIEYGPENGEMVQRDGAVTQKKKSPTYLLRQDDEFTVHTNEGPLAGHAGDYLAYDPKSGHVWPVSADYVDMHYEPYVADPASALDFGTDLPEVAQQIIDGPLTVHMADEQGFYVVAEPGHRLFMSEWTAPDGSHHLKVLERSDG